MNEVSLAVPRPLLDSLPEDDGTAARDVQEAVAGWEGRINGAIAAADGDREAAAAVVDAIERMEERFETYDEFVPELRAWGQSPVYAQVWRNLYADLIEQLYDHEELAEELDRERNARIVENGIRKER